MELKKHEATDEVNSFILRFLQKYDRIFHCYIEKR
jgi:hypothetical protein